MVDCSSKGIKSKMIKLQPGTKVHEAEARALLMALRHAENLNVEEKVKILVDDRGLLEALNKFTKENEPTFITEIRENMATLAEQGRDISINWVPSHKKIGPNERADYFAKLATTQGKHWAST